MVEPWTSKQWLVTLSGCFEVGTISPSPPCALQKKEAASKQEELDRVERAYRNLKRHEELLEASLGHISEEVKGGLSFL